MIRLAVALLVLTQGCAYRVAIGSSPAGAQLTLPDGTSTATPAVVKLRWVPLGEQIVTAAAPGYRTLQVDLRRREVRWTHYPRDLLLRPATLRGAPRGEIDLLLVPVHGPAGTWTGDDVP